MSSKVCWRVKTGCNFCLWTAEWNFLSCYYLKPLLHKCMHLDVQFALCFHHWLTPRPSTLVGLPRQQHSCTVVSSVVLQWASWLLVIFNYAYSGILSVKCSTETKWIFCTFEQLVQYTSWKFVGWYLVCVVDRMSHNLGWFYVRHTSSCWCDHSLVSFEQCRQLYGSEMRYCLSRLKCQFFSCFCHISIAFFAWLTAISAARRPKAHAIC